MPARNIIEIIVRSVTGQAKADLKGFSKDAQQDINALQKVSSVAMGVISGIVAQRTLSMISNLADWAAANMEMADSFEALSNRYNLSSTAILDALKRASKGTVAETDLIVQANKAMRLGVATSVEEFEQLMKVAYVRAKEFGISVAEAWEYIVVGIGRASPMILDNIGILMDADRTFKDYAASIGKAKDELTIYEKKQAIVNRILEEGADDLDRWGDMALSAADKTARLRAKTDEVKQAVGEMAAEVKGNLSVQLLDLTTILDQLGYIAGVTWAGMTASWRELADLIEERNLGAILAGQTQEAGESAMHAYAIIDHANKDLIPQFKEAMSVVQQVRSAVLGAAEAEEELAESTEEATKAAERATDIWHDYLTDIADEVWQFTHNWEELLFRQTQAAEDAAFRLYEIERDATQSIQDLWDRYRLDDIFDTKRHNLELRRIRRDLLDDLRDMEWEHQQEVRDMLDRAPWWIRQALQAEFEERERIAATGNKEELKRFDETLLERIRAIDPTYAEELERLEERYEHERQIEKREGRKERRRRKEDYRLERREQLAHLNLQERILRRELADQLEAWRFHDQQRLENERHALEQLRIEHEHSLETMYRDTEYRLSQLPPLYKHYGYESWLLYVQGWNDSQRDNPLGYPLTLQGYTPGGYPVFQHGIEYVPKRMLAIIDKGEAVLPAPQAERYRRGEGGITVTIQSLTVGGGLSQMTVKRLAKEVGVEMGRGIRQGSR